MKDRKKTKKYVFLKEAAEISGYHPDYIGYLIRKGKIKGKKVYNRVTWRVTPGEIIKYCKENKDIDLSDSLLSKNHLSLKEAAEISGYHPNHIAYLIRKGKIQGEKVYSGITWMTTKEAIIGYKNSLKEEKVPVVAKQLTPSYVSDVPRSNVIYDIVPPVRRAAIFVQKKVSFWMRVSQLFLRTAKYGTVAIILGIIIFGGLTIWAVATKTQIQTVEIYPTQFQGNWQNVQNIQGVPEVEPTGNLDSFSDVNSAVYKKGFSFIVLGGFEATQTDLETEIEEIETIEQQTIEQQTIEQQTIEQQPEEQQLEEQQVEGQQIEESLIEEQEEPQPEQQLEEQLEQEEQFEEQEEPQIEEMGEEEAGGEEVGEEEVSEEEEVESQETQIPESESEEGIETETETGNENEEISFLDKIKNFFASRIVKAQQIPTFTELPENEFLSAKIKFSFAIGEKVPDLELQIPEEGILEESQEEISEEIEEELLEEPEQQEEVPESTENEPTGFWNKIQNFFTTLATKAVSITKTLLDKITIVAKAEIEQDEVATEEEAEEEQLPEGEPELEGEQPPQEVLPNLDVKIIIWYSLDNQTWWQLDTISTLPLSNASNSGYFSYDAPFLKNWEDVKNLRIKFEGVVGGETRFVTYLDSVWLEINYQEEEKEDFELRALKKDWRADETPVFEIVSKGYEAPTEVPKDIVENVVEKVLSIFKEPLRINAALASPHEKDLILVEEEDFITETHSPTKITLLKPSDFRPGLYRFKVSFEKDGQTHNLEQDFTWGVLVINTNKSVYLPDDKAFLQMAVLDSGGHTICDAALVLTVINPGGKETVFKTSNLNPENGFVIEKSPECGPETVTNTPDYHTYYDMDEIGTYRMVLSQMDWDGKTELHRIEDSFEVQETVPFDVERIGPTRIYPPATYEMRMIIKAGQDFEGQIIESVPSSFEILNQELRINNQESEEFIIQEQGGGKKTLSWQNIALQQGNELELKYTFDAPDVSPYLYLLGPLRFERQETSDRQQGIIENAKEKIKDLFGIKETRPRSVVFQEARQWQIAADAAVGISTGELKGTRQLVRTSTGKIYAVFEDNGRVEVWVGINVSTDTFYFDGSDVPADDPDNSWNDETNTDDGSIATFADTTTNGSEGADFIKIEGTNASGLSNPIVKVEARMYGYLTPGGGTEIVYARIYTDGLGQTLGTCSCGGGSPAWGIYTELSVPTNGWTLAKLQALETKIWASNFDDDTAYVAKVEIRVTTAITSPDAFTQLDSSHSPSCMADSPVSVAIDSNDILHIVYYDVDYPASGSGLNYITFDTCDGGEQDNLFNIEEQAMDQEDADNTDYGCAISIDSNDIPHAVFVDSDSAKGQDYDTIYYANRIGGSWSTPLEVEGVSVSKNCNYPDITIDADNKPCISYWKSTSGDNIRAAQGNANNATTFTPATVGTGSHGTINGATSIVVDSSGNHHVAGYAYIDPLLILYYNSHSYEDAWTSWGTEEEVDTFTISYYNYSLGLVADGTDLYIFTEDIDNDDVVYYKNTGSGFGLAQTLEPGTFQDVKAKWAFWVDNDSGGSLISKTTYYFDGSDVLASDPDNVWTGETNMDDGLTTTYGNTGTSGTESTNEVQIQGTNASGNDLPFFVRARHYYAVSAGGFDNIYTKIYTDGGVASGTLLGTLLDSDNQFPSPGWGSWVNLTTPSGGWTWAKIAALESVTYGSLSEDTDVIRCYRIEIEVYTRSSATEIDYLFSDGTNVYWNKLPLVAGITVSGYFYENETPTKWDECDDSTQNVKIAVESGTTYTTACLESDGSFQKTEVEIPAADKLVSVYMSGETEKGVSITLPVNTTSAISINVYKDNIRINSESGTSVINTKLAVWDSGEDSDVPYTVTGSDLATSDSSKKIYINTGDDYAPGANVDTGKLEIVGTYSGASETLTLSGSGTGTSRPLYINGGTFTTPDITVFTGSTGSPAVEVQNTTYDELQLKPGASVTYRLATGVSQSIIINGNLIIGDSINTPIIDWDNYNPSITLGGNLTLNSPSIWTKSTTATLTWSPTGTKTWTDDNSSKQNIGIISISGGSSTPLIQLLTGAKTTTIAVADIHELQLNNQDLNITGGSLTTAGTGGTITCSGCSAGTVTILETGNLGGGSGAITFYNLTLGDNTETGTTTAQSDFTVSKVFTIEGATNKHVFDGGTKTITLSGSDTPFVINGTFTPNSSTINYTGTTATTVTATTYNNIGVGTAVDANAVTYTLGGDTTVSATLTVGNAASTATDTLAGSTYTLTLSGSGTPFNITSQGGFSEGNSTVNYTGDGATTIAAETYYNLQAGNATTQTGNREYTLGGDTTVTNVLTVGPTSDTYTHTLNASSHTLTLSNTGTPFVINSQGSFEASTSEVKYTGSGSDTNVTSTTYYNLTFTPGSATNYNAAGEIIANRQVTVNTNATFALGTNNLTVGGLGDTDSGTISNSAIITQSASATTIVKSVASGVPNIGGSGSTTFYNLTIGDSTDNISYTFTRTGTGSFTVSNDLTVTGGTSTGVHTFILGTEGFTVSNDVTINARGSLTSTSGTLTVGGSWSNSTDGIFTRNSGKVLFNSSGSETINDGGDPFYDLEFSGSGSWTYTDEGTPSGSPAISTTVQSGTVVFINARTGSVTVNGGELNVDWYLGAHVVNAADISNINTSTCSDITVSEADSQNTVWRHDSTNWVGPADSKTTGTGSACNGPSDGINAQPTNAGAIRIREYKRTSTVTTYYLYNLQITWQNSYGEYDYHDDYGDNYLTSTGNTGSGRDDVIGASWHRSNPGSINDPYTCPEGEGNTCINKAPTNGSWYIGMLSGLSFSINSFIVDIPELNDSNNFTGTANNTLTVTTSATQGYVVTAWAQHSGTGNAGELKLENFDIYIDNSGGPGTNSSPADWDGNCPNNSQCGFGYNSNDGDLSGGTIDRFVNATNCGSDDKCWAAFLDSGAGDPVADRTGPSNAQQNIITYKVSAPVTQAPGKYETTVIYICTAQY